MSPFSFYEIKSQKSKEFVNGIRKTSLACLNHPEIHFFLWLDEEEKLKQVQFVFDENLLEWAEGRKGLVASETNRKMGDFSRKAGIQKGSRTIQTSQDISIIKKGLQIIHTAEFPDTYAGLIRNNMLLPYLKPKSDPYSNTAPPHLS